MKPYLSITLLMLVLSPLSVFGFPLPPQSLRMLVQECELIVVAKVEQVAPLERQDNALINDHARATLTIQEVLKGDCTDKTVAVDFCPGMICPASPQYDAGSTIVAFLIVDKKTGVYETWCLSQGVKRMRPVSKGQPIAEIKELLLVLNEKNEARQRELYATWLMKGLLEIGYQSAAMAELYVPMFHDYPTINNLPKATEVLEDTQIVYAAALFSLTDVKEDRICYERIEHLILSRMLSSQVEKMIANFDKHGSIETSCTQGKLVITKELIRERQNAWKIWKQDFRKEIEQEQKESRSQIDQLFQRTLNK